jgi:hypothetical protein
MKIFKFKKSNKIFIEPNNNICSICLDIIESDNIITNCGHIFHTDCLCKSLKISPKCPYCRSNIIKINYRIKLQKNISNQFKKIKRFLENYTEHLLENHIGMSFTIGLPLLYLGVLLCVLCYICEMIGNNFVKNNEETSVEFVSL